MPLAKQKAHLAGDRGSTQAELAGGRVAPPERMIGRLKGIEWCMHRPAVDLDHALACHRGGPGPSRLLGVLGDLGDGLAIIVAEKGKIDPPRHSTVLPAL